MGGVTIKDVAAAAGVGIATVSRVLSGSGPVSEATRQRVLAAASALEYRPSALGRGLKTRRTGGMGLLVTDAADPFCAELTAGVLACARTQGAHVILDATREDPEAEAEALERLAEQRVEGVIAMPVQRDPAVWQALIRLGLSVVFVGRTVPGLPAVPGVLADEAGGVRSVVEYLAGLGHRRIGFLGGRAADGLAQREEAFRAALADLGIATEEDLFARARPTADSAYAAAASLFQRRPDLTAVVAGGHRLGEAAVLAARELTLRVPADVSIAIVEDVPWSELCDPPLTAVAHPARDMGYRACELLLRAPSRAPGRPVVLATELMVRASCGPITGSPRTGRSR
ncbi:LacI family DNA-binding transcriptional regulator [Actinocorallia sp. B10E7]|uniref:LacI family DNA-binding transcriptional regulator n=1 Tax=Actinocorallia sp. B10E7 TaxID=3153558 RepID=UPI00325DC504